jgi:hypothetical protein
MGESSMHVQTRVPGLVWAVDRVAALLAWILFYLFFIRRNGNYTYGAITNGVASKEVEPDT